MTSKQRSGDQAHGLDIDLIPELPSALGLPGSGGAAGQPCAETGVLVALLVFNISEA